jgi:hypothetical protein
LKWLKSKRKMEPGDTERKEEERKGRTRERKLTHS